MRRRFFAVMVNGKKFTALCSQDGIVLKEHRRRWSKAKMLSWSAIHDYCIGQFELTALVADSHNQKPKK